MERVSSNPVILPLLQLMELLPTAHCLLRWGNVSSLADCIHAEAGTCARTGDIFLAVKSMAPQIVLGLFFRCWREKEKYTCI